MVEIHWYKGSAGQSQGSMKYQHHSSNQAWTFILPSFHQLLFFPGEDVENTRKKPFSSQFSTHMSAIKFEKNNTRLSAHQRYTISVWRRSKQFMFVTASSNPVENTNFCSTARFFTRYRHEFREL